MKVSSNLETVTVYRRSAICKRRVTVDPAAVASKTVRIAGLPLCSVSTSYRAVITSGPVGLRVLDVRADFEVTLAETGDLSAEAKALEAARLTLSTLQTERARIDSEIGELSALRPEFAKPKPGRPIREASVGAVLALSDFSQQELAKRQQRRRELLVAEDQANHEVNLRAHRLAEASTSRQHERASVTRSAVLTLSEPLQAPAVFELEYEVPGVRWVPSYELRLDAGFASGSLRMRAAVAQQTGEDWAGVRISLSTAELNRRVELPELRALKIGRAQPPPPRSGFREPPPGLDALFEAYDQGHAVSGSRPGTGSAPAPAVKRAPVPPPAPRAMPAMLAMAAPAPMAPPPGMRASFAAPSAVRSELGSKSRGASAKKAAVEIDEDYAEESVASLSDDLMYAEGAAPGGGGAFDDAGTGEFAPVMPRWGLDVSMFDYARLSIGGPDAGSQRGRLQPSALVIAHTSIQTTVVLQLVQQAIEVALGPEGLRLPDRCQPVGSVHAFDYRYDCETVNDVPSTGRWVTVPVMQCAVDLAPVFICVPSVEPRVYRSLTLNNTSVHALLPGPVDVSVGTEFLVTAELPAMSPGAAGRKLGLGAEEAIKVSRKTEFREASGGFLGGSSVLTHDLEIEVNNRLSNGISLEVHERVPVADDLEKDIKVEEASSSPAWSVLEPLPGEPAIAGARRWSLKVGPQERTVLKAQYVVRIPADKTLVGGNRRV